VQHFPDIDRVGLLVADAAGEFEQLGLEHVEAGFSTNWSGGAVTGPTGARTDSGTRRTRCSAAPEISAMPWYVGAQL